MKINHQNIALLSEASIKLLQNCQKRGHCIDIDLISGHFCGLVHQYLAKFLAQFNIDNEKKFGDLKKRPFFAAGHLMRPAILATLTVLPIPTGYTLSLVKKRHMIVCRKWTDNLINI